MKERIIIEMKSSLEKILIIIKNRKKEKLLSVWQIKVIWCDQHALNRKYYMMRYDCPKTKYKQRLCLITNILY